jgi:hypothetical protein
MKSYQVIRGENSMNRFARLPALLALLMAPSAFAGEQAVCDRPFQAAFRSGSELHLDVRAGDIEIMGSDESMIYVSCEVRGDHSARDISIRFEDNGKSGRLQISGGPDNDVRLRIRVPRDSHLVVRCTAGDLDLTGVRGNKDVSLRAGDLTIDVGNPADYAFAEASVKAGDLHASAFGVNKGGLFRSFKHENPAGKYRLRASLWAGDITLR